MSTRLALVVALCACPAVALAQEAASAPRSYFPIWRGGTVVQGAAGPGTAEREGLLTLDLGEGWTPDLFSSGSGADGSAEPSSYRDTFLALAREDYSAQEARAAQDRYLELYGIPPTLSVLRARLHASQQLRCGNAIDDATLLSFRGAEGPRVSRAAWRTAIAAVQRRLACYGYLRARRYSRGTFDRPTRNALAELERRNRIYARGRLTAETLQALRTSPAELDRTSVVRVLTERALLAAGVIEDEGVLLADDGSRRTWRDAAGHTVQTRDLGAELSERVVGAFGLATPASTAAWLDGLGELPSGQHRLVAIRGVDLPAYYGPDMDLHVVIDRGDISYALPVDARGRALSLPTVQRRPTLSLFVSWRGQDILLARYQTTIGGWQIEASSHGDRWRYYESPTGPAAWERILAAPVWLPPAQTPPADLVTQFRLTETGRLVREVKRYLLGPGYASAYGLVAAYHRTATLRPDGSVARLGSDDGIRTHGSVDYTSIWRSASHGCHRLHNHLAVRLFEFVLAHRAHRRLGESPIDFRAPVDIGEVHDEIRVTHTGYVFELERPLPVDVLVGRVVGARQTAPTFTVPVAGVGRPDAGGPPSIGRRTAVRHHPRLNASDRAPARVRVRDRVPGRPAGHRALPERR